MFSVIDKTIKEINGVMCIVPKEYPNWYGIKDIGFIRHNEWADPEIEYKGKRIDSLIVEDTMRERYTHDDDGNFLEEKEKNEDGFVRYMYEEANEIYYLIELAIESMEEE